MSFIIDPSSIIADLPDTERSSVAASLTWKLAFSAGSLLAVLLSEEQDEDSKLESLVSERLAALSDIAPACSRDIRPDPQDVVQKLGVARTSDNQGMDAQELAEVMDVSLEEAQEALKANAKEQEAKAEALAASARANAQEIARRLESALTSQVGWEEPSLNLQHRLGEWMADKLDQRMTVLLQKAARTNRRRLQAQLAADRRLVKDVLDRLDADLEKVEQLIDQRPEPGA